MMDLTSLLHLEAQNLTGCPSHTVRVTKNSLKLGSKEVPLVYLRIGQSSLDIMMEMLFGDAIEMLNHI